MCGALGAVGLTAGVRAVVEALDARLALRVDGRERAVVQLRSVTLASGAAPREGMRTSSGKDAGV